MISDSAKRGDIGYLFLCTIFLYLFKALYVGYFSDIIKMKNYLGICEPLTIHGRLVLSQLPMKKYYWKGEYTIMNRNDVLTDPKKLVRLELKKEGFDLDKMNIPERVFLLADSLYDAMLSRNCGTYKYPLGGELFVFNENENIGFIKGHMCSPAIATQAEDLIAGGVKELIHIGFAGGLQPDMEAGDIVLTDGAYNDTAVARLYGFDYDMIESTKKLTDELSAMLIKNEIPFKRGIHWTTDAGYRETWGQTMEYREKGALCVEMEGVGLFTIANYRNCAASAIYVVSDVHIERGWELGWEENRLEQAVDKVIDMIVRTVAN